MRLTYNDLKRAWERRTFKVISSGNYVRENETGGREVMSDRLLNDAFKQLHYLTASRRANGTHEVVLSPFIARWTRDPVLRSYQRMDMLPPPLEVPPATYNQWTGFAVERYAVPPGSEVDTDSTAVRAYLDLIATLCRARQGPAGARAMEYVLDWLAHMFQHPARKPGVALLLHGPEGVGKNRFTDLLRHMQGSDRFFQTASPAATLYGRFNRQREGRILIVINEANGGENFAANDILKDMITCDEFVSEGKHTNSYTMRCFARFVFTTNNDNCLRVPPDGRRIVVIDASPERKGYAGYFAQLSAHIEDAHGRYEFYRYLMARDLTARPDCLQDRPVTEYHQQMVEMNLPFEYQFLRHEMLRRLRDGELVANERPDALYEGFSGWLRSNETRAVHGVSSVKFGHRVTKVATVQGPNATPNPLAFRGLVKQRRSSGVRYRFELPEFAREMAEKLWASPEDVEDAQRAGERARRGQAAPGEARDPLD